jgi:hypothetical protein
MTRSVEKSIFVVSATFLVALALFAYGVVVGRFGAWPHAHIQNGWQAASSYFRFGEVAPRGRLVIAPAGASRETVTLHQAGRLEEGSYAIMGWDSTDKRYAAWLYGRDGKPSHRWRIDYDRLDPDGPSNGSDAPHAFYVLPDASIIVGFDRGDLMVRLDDCGRVIWQKDGVFHHAVSPAEDGSFWTWRGERTAYGHFHYLHNFDGRTGRAIREIGLIEDVIRGSGEGSHVFGVRPDYPFRRSVPDPRDDPTGDLFHPNDIEPLSAQIADRFPLFADGDLLVSFRNINLIAVIGPTSGRVKWSSNGPWLAQHDPDYLDDGTLSVYSNNTGRGRSEIIRIDPVSMATQNALFDGDAIFSSDTMGTHQYLPNGNIVITVPEEGRVLEVTERGELVLEFNNVAVGLSGVNGHVANAMWVPVDYFDRTPGCQE